MLVPWMSRAPPEHVNKAARLVKCLQAACLAYSMQPGGCRVCSCQVRTCHKGKPRCARVGLASRQGISSTASCLQRVPRPFCAGRGTCLSQTSAPPTCTSGCAAQGPIRPVVLGLCLDMAEAQARLGASAPASSAATMRPDQAGLVDIRTSTRPGPGSWLAATSNACGAVCPPAHQWCAALGASSSAGPTGQPGRGGSRQSSRLLSSWARHLRGAHTASAKGFVQSGQSGQRDAVTGKAASLLSMAFAAAEPYTDAQAASAQAPVQLLPQRMGQSPAAASAHLARPPAVPPPSWPFWQSRPVHHAAASVRAHQPSIRQQGLHPACGQPQWLDDQGSSAAQRPAGVCVWAGARQAPWRTQGVTWSRSARRWSACAKKACASGLLASRASRPWCRTLVCPMKGPCASARPPPSCAWPFGLASAPPSAATQAVSAAAPPVTPVGQPGWSCGWPAASLRGPPAAGAGAAVLHAWPGGTSAPAC